MNEMMNRIINADCIEAMKEIPDGSIDMILCDPPYGTTDCKWDQVIPFDQLWEQYRRIVKENGAIVLFAQQPFATDLINSNRQWFRYEWIWEKTKALGFLNAKRMPLRCHENVLVFYKRLPVYNPQFTVGTPYVSKSDGKSKKTSLYRAHGKAYETVNPGRRYPRDVVRFASNSKEMLHPTQKPIELAEYLIRTYTNVGDIVLDNCAGSGTSCVAAIRNDRRFVGIEKETEYATIAQQRCDREQAEKAKYRKFGMS